METNSIAMCDLMNGLNSSFGPQSIYAVTSSMIYDPDVGSNKDVEETLIAMGFGQFAISQWMCVYGQLLIQCKFLISQLIVSKAIIEYTVVNGVLLLTVVDDE